MPLKPGYKTTEFLVTLLISLGALATALAGALPPKWAAVAVAAAGVSYTLSRGLAKAGGGGGN